MTPPAHRRGDGGVRAATGPGRPGGRAVAGLQALCSRSNALFAPCPGVAGTLACRCLRVSAGSSKHLRFPGVTTRTRLGTEAPSKHPEQQAPCFQPPASRLTPPATLPSVPGRGERAAASGGRGELGAPAPAPRLTAGRIVSPSGRALCVPCSRDTRVESRGQREQQAGRVSPARAQAAPLTA